MNQDQLVFIGVDVSKDELVVCMGARTAQRQIVANNAAAIAAWLCQVPGGALIAMESTGRYHGLLAHMAHHAGLQVYVLNARDVYFYARALGMRGKTDGVDAGVITRYLAEHYRVLHPWQEASTVCKRVQELLTRRAQVSSQRAALAQMFVGVDPTDVDPTGVQNALFALMKAMDAKVIQLIESDQQLGQGYRRLLTVPGIGPQVGALLVILFDRIRFANADAVVAYTGLDPRPNDSGTKRGRRQLSKRGPSLLRRQIYLVGFAASRSKAFKTFYQSIRAKGRAPTESFVILGRKLLRVAFAIWKGTQDFDPARWSPKTS